MHPVNLITRRALAVIAAPLLAFGAAARGDISLPPGCPENVSWAAADLGAALADHHLAVSDARVEVSIGSASGTSSAAQSFSITTAGDRVRLSGGGAVGAMYGLLELAEQLRHAPTVASWAAFAASLRPVSESPFLEVRADNAFVHVYPLDLTDTAQWHAYIDMLARNRFNVLDLHGSYDLESTSFPNLYPLLVHVPEYPNIGDPAAQAKNLAAFRDLIAHAKARGIDVAFMNYSANDGRAGVEKNAPSITGIPPEKLADYTSKAVTLLIQALPELSMLGFRVGESGRDAAFFEESYIKGVRDAHRPDLRLYTRSWQTTKQQLLPIAAIAPSGFDIEVKYNGEQLGLPYQALQTKFGTYSYETYLDVPAGYRILWQVRANGTHRFWTWENTDFIRRAVQTFTLGNARGFTLEPPTSYFSTDPATRYRDPADRQVYTYIWQKSWAWYAAWGRISYRPDLDDHFLLSLYEDHFGRENAQSIYAAQQFAAVIVPLSLAYRFPGPDHRDFSPETETGNLSAKHQQEIPLLLQFIDNHPEDERSFASIGTFVDNKLAGRADGRVGPLAVARRLADAASETRRLVGQVDANAANALGAGEWRLLRADLLSASYLGSYYADRITGLVHLGYALRTGTTAEYEAGIAGLAASRADWSRLAETADAIYGPLSNPLRRQLKFQWAHELPGLERVDATAPGLWAARHPDHIAAPLQITPHDSGAPAGLQVARLQAEPAADRLHAVIHCEAHAPGGVAHAVLWYKALPSQLAWESMPMTADGDAVYTATVPLTPEGLMYHVEIQAASGDAENFPNVFSATPYLILPPFPPHV